MSHHHDTDRQLDDLLRSLPRIAAPPGFAARASRSIRTAARPRIRLWLPVATAAAAIIAAILASPVLRDPPPRRDIAALDEEYRRLAAELEALETLRASARPVVYLGSGAQTDFVLDLDRLARRRPARAPRQSPMQAGRALPVRFEKGDQP